MVLDRRVLGTVARSSLIQYELPNKVWALTGQSSRISHRRVEVTTTRKTTGGFRK